jgi:hypothetical protein
MPDKSKKPANNAVIQIAELLPPKAIDTSAAPIPFDEAVERGKDLFAKMDALHEADALIQFLVGEIADKVEPKLNGEENTLAELAKGLGRECETVRRYRSFYRAWKGSSIWATWPSPSFKFSLLREIATHPNREQLLRDNPNMTVREARELRRALNGDTLPNPTLLLPTGQTKEPAATAAQPAENSAGARQAPSPKSKPNKAPRPETAEKPEWFNNLEQKLREDVAAELCEELEAERQKVRALAAELITMAGEPMYSKPSEEKLTKTGDAQVDRMRALWKSGRDKFASFYTALHEVRKEVGDAELPSWCIRNLGVGMSIIVRTAGILRETDAEQVEQEFKAAQKHERQETAKR